MARLNTADDAGSRRRACTKRWLRGLTALGVWLSGCQQDEMLPPLPPQPSVAIATSTPEAVAPAPLVTPVADTAPYLNAALPIDVRVEDLLTRMTVAEKVGQMTQIEKNSVTLSAITEYGLGSLLSGGGGSPDTNTAAAWAEMTNRYQEYALKTRLRIPLIYGVDAVHGHGNLKGATIFPHNIGLGATRDPELVERIGRATAAEVAATGIRWNFAPVVAVVQDIRWGRTYEGFGEDTDLVGELGAAYILGLQTTEDGEALNPARTVLATAKHFLGDGATAFGSATTIISRPYLLDQGDTLTDEDTLRRLYLPPYEYALEAGVQSIMVSFSSWNGKKMHAHKYLLTDVLKGELAFDGFLISDWQAIDQIPGDFYSDVVTSINAGLDMIMVPYDYATFTAQLTRAVNEGKIPMSRIDDAVRRILRVKFALGLFEHPYADPQALRVVGSSEHRAIAGEAVRKSLVLLKNHDQTLPIAKDTPLIFVAGQAADDIGLQSGGWTIEWQGKAGSITPGSTILDGIQTLAAPASRVVYNRFGHFYDVVDPAGIPMMADVAVVVIAEAPYAEGVGDRAELNLDNRDILLIEHVKAQSRRVVVVLLSGRPLIVSQQLPGWDAFVAAWLPGSEGAAVADVLFGDYDFTGRLSYTWPRWNEQLPLDFQNLPTEGCDAPLFPYGYGLSLADPSPEQLVCPKAD